MRAVTPPHCLGMVAALAYEAALVRRCLRLRQGTGTLGGPLWHGSRHCQYVVLLQSGMGPQRATQAATWLVQHYALDALLSVGFAGGLHAALRTGEAVLPLQIGTVLPPAKSAVSGGASTIRPDAHLVHLAALAARRADLTPRYGTLLSVPTVLTEAAAKADLAQQSGALAVDMESFSLAQIAAASGVPFVAVRTVFDTRADTLPLPTPGFTTAEGTLLPGRLLRHLLSHPRTLRQLPPLWRKARHAGRCLSAWLEQFLLLRSQEGAGRGGRAGGRPGGNNT